MQTTHSLSPFSPGMKDLCPIVRCVLLFFHFICEEENGVITICNGEGVWQFSIFFSIMSWLFLSNKYIHVK